MNTLVEPALEEQISPSHRAERVTVERLTAGRDQIIAELAKVIRRLEPGDVLVVTRLDRLARSTRDLLNVLATISEREAGFRSLKDAWASGAVRKPIGAAVSTNGRRMSDAPSVNGARTATGAATA